MMITHEDLERAIKNILSSLEYDEQIIIEYYFGFGRHGYGNKEYLMQRFQMDENQINFLVEQILYKIRLMFGESLKPYFEELKERIQLREYREESRLDKNIPVCGNRNPLKPEDYQYLPIIPRIKPVYYFSRKFNKYVPY